MIVASLLHSSRDGRGRSHASQGGSLVRKTCVSEQSSVYEIAAQPPMAASRTASVPNNKERLFGFPHDARLGISHKQRNKEKTTKRRNQVISAGCMQSQAVAAADPRPPGIRCLSTSNPRVRSRTKCWTCMTTCDRGVQVQPQNPAHARCTESFLSEKSCKRQPLRASRSKPSGSCRFSMSHWNPCPTTPLILIAVPMYHTNDSFGQVASI